jgi:transposase
VTIVDAGSTPVYLKIGTKAAHLRELGMSDRAIARAIGVSDKTVAKAIGSERGTCDPPAPPRDRPSGSSSSAIVRSDRIVEDRAPAAQLDGEGSVDDERIAGVERRQAAITEPADRRRTVR